MHPIFQEGNVLFNDALNTFYFTVIWRRTYGKGPLRQGFFYMYNPTDRIAHTTTFVTPVLEHWLEREIAQWVHTMKDRSDDPSHHERTLLPRSYISLPNISVSRCTGCCIVSNNGAAYQN